MRCHEEKKLKNGKTCVLRNAEGSDAGEILRHLRLTSGETDHMLRYPEEFSMSEREEAEYLDATAESADAILISAVVDGRLAGSAGLSPVCALEKCAHRAEFGISVRKEFWGLGIGSLLLEAALGAARRAGYGQVELDVVEGNERACALYRKFGFHVYGRHERAFRLRDGSYQNLTLMLLEL